MSSRKTPSVRGKRTNSLPTRQGAQTPKGHTPYAMAPQQELSLVAYFDDMVRLRDTLFEEINVLHDKLKLVVTQAETNRSQWQSSEKALEKEKIRSKHFEEELARTNLTLKQVREAYRKEVMLKESIKKERNDFLEKLQNVREYLGEDRNLDRAKILNSLNSLHTLIEVTEPEENSASSDSLSISFDKTEEEGLAEARRSSGAVKRRSSVHDDAFLTSGSPTKKVPHLTSYESNLKRLSTRGSDGANNIYPCVHFQPPPQPAAEPQVQTVKQAVPSNAYLNQLQGPPKPRRSQRTNSDPDGCEEMGFEEENRVPPTYHHATVGGIGEFRAPSRDSDTISTASTTSLKRRSLAHNHVLALKKFFKSETCNGCNKKISFCVNGYKCSVCHSSCHTECRDKLPKCIPYVPPNAKHRKGLSIGAFVQGSTRPAIPPLIYHLVEEIESRNLKDEGLYRVGAADREIEALTEKLIHAKHGLPSLKQYDVHLLGNVLKRFFRYLDEPLLTRVLWRDFVNAAEKKDPEERKNLLIQAITELPPANRDTLVYMIEHFHRIIQMTGKMDIKAISRVFAPTLVGHSMVNPPVDQIMAENTKQINVLESILNLPIELWAHFTDDDQVSKMKHCKRTSIGTRILGGNCSSGYLTPYKKSQMGSASGQVSQSGLTLKPLF